jgi:hypothetical protein
MIRTRTSVGRSAPSSMHGRHLSVSMPSLLDLSAGALAGVCVCVRFRGVEPAGCQSIT